MHIQLGVGQELLIERKGKVKKFLHYAAVRVGKKVVFSEKRNDCMKG